MNIAKRFWAWMGDNADREGDDATVLLVHSKISNTAAVLIGAVAAYALVFVDWPVGTATALLSWSWRETGKAEYAHYLTRRANYVAARKGRR